MEKIPQDVNLTQQCFERLERDIINNLLSAGEKLKIQNLREFLGVGQSPLREALSRLAALGLVEIKPNRGFYVATISENDIRDIYQTFNEIENSALKKAIKFGDDRWASQIVATLYELSLVEAHDTISNPEIWAQRNYAFHGALIAGCNSPTLLQIRNDLHKRFDRYCRMSYALIKHTLQHNHNEHKALAEAALSGNSPKAVELMNNHICGSLEVVIESLKKNKLLI